MFLKHFGRYVLFRGNWLTLSHPDENQPLNGYRGEFPRSHPWCADHLRIRTFGKKGHAITVPIKGGPMVRASQKSLVIAAAHRKIHGTVRTPVQQGLDFPVFVPEEDHIGAEHPEDRWLVALYILGREGRIPVFPISCWRDPATAV
jgi:hypothetical protein